MQWSGIDVKRNHRHLPFRQRGRKGRILKVHPVPADVLHLDTLVFDFQDVAAIHPAFPVEKLHCIFLVCVQEIDIFGLLRRNYPFHHLGRRRLFQSLLSQHDVPKRLFDIYQQLIDAVQVEIKVRRLDELCPGSLDLRGDFAQFLSPHFRRLFAIAKVSKDQLCVKIIHLDEHLGDLQRGRHILRQLVVRNERRGILIALSHILDCL